MELLESAMAFAVVMILLSTIVTGIVELLLRIAGLREKTLRDTVASLFENVVWPRLEERFKGAAAEGDEAETKAEARKDFIDGMTLNPVAADPAGLPDLWRHKSRVDALSVLAFAERLARTEVGKAIVAEGRHELEPLVQDFVRSFERFGRAASEVYRKNAKQVAIVVGIFLAFAANIEAGRLFTSLMENPNLRTSLIEQVDGAVQANQQAIEGVDQLLKEIDSGGLTEDQKIEIKEEVAKVQASIAKLKGEGLPIGHNFYPYCAEGKDGHEPCATSLSFRERMTELKFWRWALLTATAGVLIGLGGPFWFRVFSSLSQIFQVLRAIGITSKPQQARPEEVANSKVEDSAKPKDVLDAFTVAAHVHAKGSAGQSTLFAGAPAGSRRFID